MSRRRLLSVGLLSAGTVTLVGAPLVRAATLTTVWGLDPSAGRGSCGCAACGACRAHAANKLFASAAAADAGRAHGRCRCTVVELAAVDSSVYATLFTTGAGRHAVDRRWQWVQAALAATPSIPAPTPVVPADPSGSPASPSEIASGSGAAAEPHKPACAARSETPRLRSAWIRRAAGDRRTLFVQVEAAGSVAVTLVLKRRGRALARRHVPAVTGRRTIPVPIGAGALAGPATLTVKFREADGRTATASRSLSVPRKHSSVA